MDLQELELAAKVIFAMCEQHPEICPHIYAWQGGRTHEDGHREDHYRCQLCGHKKKEYDNK